LKKRRHDNSGEFDEQHVINNGGKHLSRHRIPLLDLGELGMVGGEREGTSRLLLLALPWNPVGLRVGGIAGEMWKTW
jgi:hypothetical protein